jgi:hypothetical protein
MQERPVFGHPHFGMLSWISSLGGSNKLLHLSLFTVWLSEINTWCMMPCWVEKDFQQHHINLLFQAVLPELHGSQQWWWHSHGEFTLGITQENTQFHPVTIFCRKYTSLSATVMRIPLILMCSHSSFHMNILCVECWHTHCIFRFVLRMIWPLWTEILTFSVIFSTIWLWQSSQPPTSLSDCHCSAVLSESLLL